MQILAGTQTLWVAALPPRTWPSCCEKPKCVERPSVSVSIAAPAEPPAASHVPGSRGAVAQGEMYLASPVEGNMTCCSEALSLGGGALPPWKVAAQPLQAIGPTAPGPWIRVKHCHRPATEHCHMLLPACWPLSTRHRPSAALQDRPGH